MNYELKKESIVRKDYVTKTLLKYVEEIDYNNYKWIEYDSFKKEEFKIIKKTNNNLKVEAIDDLIESLNNLNIKKEKNLIERDNGDDLFDNEEKNISDKEDCSSENLSGSENMNDEIIKKNEFCDYKIPDLCERIVKR